MIDYYKILGVSRDATAKDINTAYKKLALKYHPDKSNNEADSLANFRKIQEAIEVLRDPVRKEEYDNALPYPWETNDDNLEDYDQILRSGSYDYDEFTAWEEERAAEIRQEEEAQMRQSERQHQQECNDKEEANRRSKREWQTKRAEAMKARIIRDEETLNWDEQDEPEMFSDIPIYEWHENHLMTTTKEDNGPEDSKKDSIVCSNPYPLIDLSDPSESGDQGRQYDSGIQELLDDGFFFDDAFAEVAPTEDEQNIQDLYERLSRFFHYKLTESDGNYSLEDLQTEVAGLCLESMQQYFQDLRSRFMDNRVVLDNEQPLKCYHLGPWQKDFNNETCDACGSWMPLYTMSCPSCKVKACVSCKYQIGKN